MNRPRNRIAARAETARNLKKPSKSRQNFADGTRMFHARRRPDDTTAVARDESTEGACSMAEILPGKPAPKFSLPDQNGETVTLASLKGSPFVLYFYPKDDTSGCTKEACAFRDDFPAYADLGAKVIGVSPDSVASHAKFIKKYELPFTLLSDPEKTTLEAYGVWKEKSMYGRKYMGVERTTLVIDSKGIIRHVFPKVKVPGHSEAVLKALKESE
jgi:peroxiredoxin Q/BCP